MSQGKHGQKGVEAIFTPLERTSRRSILVGAGGILVGIALWTTVILSIGPIRVIHDSAVTPYLPLMLTSLGILFTSCGTGICITVSQSHDKKTAVSASLNTRFSIVVFLQSLILLTLYSGMVLEYQSNLTMRQWLRSIRIFGDYLLSDWAVVVSSVLLAVLVVVSLTRREFQA